MPAPSPPAPDRVGAASARATPPGTLHDGPPDFDTTLLPVLRAHRFFLEASEEEIEASYACYARGEGARLGAVWAEVAAPVRARQQGVHALLYRLAGHLPGRLLGLAFLSMTRGVLEAGKRVRDQLRPDVRAAITGEFPWLEARHEHIPAGWTPRIDFPPEFAAFLEAGSLDDARVRWQLLTALNEVQQAHSSTALGALFRVPEITRHAERERELGASYFAHWSPPVTRALWAQSLHILDGLNAAVFAALSGRTGHAIRARAALGLITGGAQWRAFRDGLERPQRLLAPVPADPRAP